MNYNTYDFTNNEFYDNTAKYIWYILFIFANGFILLSCIYVLIFIIIPIIYFRIAQCSSKNSRISNITEKMGESKISLLNNRFTTEIL